MASVIEGGGIQGSSYVNQDLSSGTLSSTAAAKAADIAQVGKEQVKKLTGNTRDTFYQRADAKKGEVVQGLHDLVSTLESASRQVPDGIARSVIDNAVGFINKASSRIENGSTEELLRDAQGAVRVEFPGDDPFFNINRPADLDAARKRLSERPEWT